MTMADTDTEEFPKNTDLNNLALTLVARLNAGAVSVCIENRDAHWFVTTEWPEE
jgi:hypothetical protein